MRNTAYTLADLRRRAGLSMQSLAIRMGYKNASSYQRYEGPDFEKEALPPDFVKRLDPAIVGLGNPPITKEEVWVLSGLPSIRAHSETSGHLSIPVYDTPVSAGPGTDVINQNVEPIFYYDLPHLWLREKLRAIPDPSYLIIVRVAGISMRPLINSGDLVLVNCAVRSFVGDAIYLLRSLDILQLKRVMLDYSTNKYQIISENPSYAAVKMESPEIEIQGRADWIFKMEEL